MTDIAKLKRRAADLESNKELAQAIVVYREIIEMFENGEADPIDIPLYNRLGDLLHKVGETADAVAMWERAVDHYADGGFYNPAIALCNKILRHSPGRTVVYYKLGRILAAKGFRVEARQNFVEYANRTQQAGDIEEAFRALKEFADLVPEETDVRLMLAEQLVNADRVDEAIEQLQLAHAQLSRQGKTGEADAVAARIRALDPEAELRDVQQDRAASGDGLVFLDLGAVNLPRPTGVFDGGVILPTEEASEHDLLLPPPERGFVGQPRAAESEFGLEALTPVETQWSGSDLLEGFDTTALPPELPPDPGLAPIPTAAPVGETEVAPIEESPSSPIADLPLLEPATMEAIPLIEIGEIPPRRVTSVALAPTVDGLATQVADAPTDWRIRRQYGEALLDAGRRDEGIAELERALELCRDAGDVDGAASLAEELVRVAPDTVRFHQRRVESAVTTSDPARVSLAFLDLGDALVRSGAPARASVVYQRVLEIDPNDERARSSLAAIEVTARRTTATAPVSAATDRRGGDRRDPARQSARPPALERRVSDRRANEQRTSAAVARSPEAETAPSPPAAAASGEDGFVSLGDWLQESIQRGSQRIVVAAERPTRGTRSVDFQAILTQFQQGPAAAVPDDDHAAHYELGVAYREMGLLDEAIAEFQKAMRSPVHRVRTLEALGGCFIEKGQQPVGQAILERALSEPGASDRDLIGVLYLLAVVAEGQGALADAVRYYQRVAAVDPRFRDVGARLASLAHAPPT